MSFSRLRNKGCLLSSLLSLEQVKAWALVDFPPLERMRVQGDVLRPRVGRSLTGGLYISRRVVNSDLRFTYVLIAEMIGFPHQRHLHPLGV